MGVRHMKHPQPLQAPPFQHLLLLTNLEVYQILPVPDYRAQSPDPSLPPWRLGWTESSHTQHMVFMVAGPILRLSRGPA